MIGAFDFVQQSRYAIQAETGLESTEVSSFDLEGRRGLCGASRQQASPEGVVDHFSEGPAGLPCFGLQLGGHVVIKRQSRTHVKMLGPRHHDVNRNVIRC